MTKIREKNLRGKIWDRKPVAKELAQNSKKGIRDSVSKKTTIVVEEKLHGVIKLQQAVRLEKSWG